MSAWVTLREIDHDAADALAAACSLDQRIAAILLARKIDTPEAVFRYLAPSRTGLHSPFLLKGMDAAVSRFRNALAAGEKIGIFADSDLDGISSLSILFRLLTRLGADPWYRYSTGDESYGIKIAHVDEAAAAGVRLLVTVDTGMGDAPEIAHARGIGLDVIVIDHHEEGEALPDAIIVNPKAKACPYPFKHLAGVGVTFKVCQALLYSYQPGFDRTFFLLLRNGETISIIRARNGVTELLPDRPFPSENVIVLAEGLFDFPDGDCIIVTHGLDEVPAERLCARTFMQFRLIDLARTFLPALKQPPGDIDAVYRLLDIEPVPGADPSRLALDLFLELQFRGSPKIHAFLDSIMGFVSIGTIADIMPLVQENRVLVAGGIRSLSESPIPRFVHLLGQERISAKTIGWNIAPLLNTPGRFGRSDLTVNFLLDEDDTRIIPLVEEIASLNEKRKEIAALLIGEIMGDIGGGRIVADDNVVIVSGKEIPEGLVGLLANRLVEETGKPAIVTASPGVAGLIKGSGRAMAGYDFLSLVRPFAHLFVKIGGHAQAFGFTCTPEALETFMVSIRRVMRDFPPPPQVHFVDLELQAGTITRQFVRSLLALEPFGNGNEEPVFLTRNLTVHAFSYLGQGKKHGRYLFRDLPGIPAIGWGRGETMEMLAAGKTRLDVIYTLENSYFRDAHQARMIIRDLRPCEDLN